MVDEVKLSSVLSEFAFTLATDFPIRSILDHLVERIVTVLPVTGAGVTLIAPGTDPRYIAASDDTVLRFERLQSDLAEGPCLLAYESDEPVVVPDLARDVRFPRFGPDAYAAGLAAVFTFPLRHRDERFGALDLYRDTPGDLDSHTMEVAQTLANVAAAYLLNAYARETASRRSVEMRNLAMHDALTGLPNRLLLEERIEHASKRAQRSHARAGVLFIDLDRFKAVNDTHGHQAGDQLLQSVARRLTHLVRPGDTVARVHGDEFVLLCEDLDGRRDVEALAERVRRAFMTPFPISGGALEITASVGVAFAGPGEYISEHLLTQADSAMYDAKRGGLGHKIVDLLDPVAPTETSLLSQDLGAACDSGDLHIAYQPLVRCQDGRAYGVEALLRWNHPKRGPVPAPSIVAVAEQSGLISQVGEWVLTQACRDNVKWRREHPSSPLDLAVNVSAYQLMTTRFITEVTDVLTSTGMDPTALVLEVTENILIEDSELAQSVLGALRGLGIRVALDDFGTGYSSLSYLHRLPIDILKIDQSFVSNIDVAPKGRAIVAAVVDLAHALDLLVVAEGVETQSQRAAVSATGADNAQGYFYAAPMLAEEVDDLLASASPGVLHLYGDALTA